MDSLIYLWLDVLNKEFNFRRIYNHNFFKKLNSVQSENSEIEKLKFGTQFMYTVLIDMIGLSSIIIHKAFD